MIRSMLYATDLGVYAPVVMQHALAMARTFKADLYVIHAVEPLGLFAESVLQSYLDAPALSELHSLGLTTVMATIESKVMADVREEVGEGSPDLDLIRAVRVFQGDPSEVILDQTQRLGVDLVILGSHCQGRDGDAPLGRTAGRVMQLSPVPVYMVPLSSPQARWGS